MPCVFGQHCPMGSVLPLPGTEAAQDYVDQYKCRWASPTMLHAIPAAHMLQLGAHARLASWTLHPPCTSVGATACMGAYGGSLP